MNNQIRKYAIACLQILLASISCYGQFKVQTPREGFVKGKVDSVIYTNFNVKGDLIKGKEFNDRCTYFFNDNGLLVKEHVSDDEENNSIIRTVYIHGEKDYLKQVMDYSSNGSLQNKETYYFDSLKRIVKVTDVDMVTSELLLDKAGNILKETIYHKYPTPFTTLQFKYDKNNLCVESFQSWSQSPKNQKIIYVYDRRRNLVKESTYNNESLSSTYTYDYSKFDKFNNWLVQKVYKTGRLDGLSERTIGYK